MPACCMHPGTDTLFVSTTSELAVHRHLAMASSNLPTCHDKSAHFEECHLKRRARNCLAAFLYRGQQYTLLIEL
jgi:hypothetical protein